MKLQFFVFAAILACVSARSHAAELTKIGEIVLPETTALYPDADDREDQTDNMSAILCPSRDWCVVASDELHGFHRLKVTRDASDIPSVSYDAALDLGEPAPEFLASHGLGNNIKEFDLEAIASSGDEVYFFGSHGNKRKKGRVNPGAHLVAIASVADLQANTVVPARWISLDALFKVDPVLGDRLNQQLQCGGLNIEGATILGNKVYIGVRIPSRSTNGEEPGAYVVSTPLAGFAAEDFTGAKRHVLPMDEPFIAIRSMETVGDSVLVVTGDAGVSALEGSELQCPAGLNKEDEDRPFQLRLWKPPAGDTFDSEPLVTFDRLDVDGDVAKLEGIAADPGHPGGFFIVYDGDDNIRYLQNLQLN